MVAGATAVRVGLPAAEPILMIVVRAAILEDTDQLWDLIRQATYGMTTLQITKEQLTERIELSHFAFARKTERPGSDLYVFVMEDLGKRKLVGTSCIFSKTGGYEPFYSYRRVIESSECELLGTTKRIESLQLQKIHDGPTEIGSLFLLPEYRGHGRGRLLSLTRFIFMARHPKRFSEDVIAEMRGQVEEDGNCPFWEAIGRKFFDMDFPQADSLSTIDKRFIEDLMPRHPIYVCLLPQSAQSVLSQVHPQTRPALAMLQEEGFVVGDMVDIFDGGPIVHCKRDEISAVKRTVDVAVADIVERVEGTETILASRTGGFRSMLGRVKIEEQGAVISETAALTLGLKQGDTLWLLDPHANHGPAA